MAKMHSRAKGKSGSHKPLVKTKPEWMPITNKELELLIAKLAKDGYTPSQIGLHLRDSYGVPDVRTVLGKTVTQVLQEKKLLKELPEDVIALMRRAIMVHKHMQENKHDMTAKRGLQLTEAKIARLTKYYKSTKRISKDWKYSLEQASFYVE
jgi:small subunit ribosomal protein S15